MITQKFRGDANELRMEAAGAVALDIASASKDAMLAGGFDATPFLLMLYDSGRMPFSDRVPREAFVEFFRGALARFPVVGTFESYLFIIQAIFGSGSGVLFNVPGPGHLELLVNAGSSIAFDFAGREFVDGAFTTFTMQTMDGDTLQFRGISGIDSEYKLNQLLSELIPNGIFTEVTLAFFSLYDFVALQGGALFNLIDHEGNQIVFFESGE